MTAKSFEFEKALTELEEITQWFESPKVDLDQGLVKFERGMELAENLKTHLVSVENRVEKIRQRFSASPDNSSEPSNTEAQPTALESTNTPPRNQSDLFGD